MFKILFLYIFVLIKNVQPLRTRCSVIETFYVRKQGQPTEARQTSHVQQETQQQTETWINWHASKDEVHKFNQRHLLIQRLPQMFSNPSSNFISSISCAAGKYTTEALLKKKSIGIFALRTTALFTPPTLWTAVCSCSHLQDRKKSHIYNEVGFHVVLINRDLG